MNGVDNNAQGHKGDDSEPDDGVPLPAERTTNVSVLLSWDSRSGVGVSIAIMQASRDGKARASMLSKNSCEGLAVHTSIDI